MCTLILLSYVCVRTSEYFTKYNLRFFSTSRTYLWFYLRNFLCGLTDMCVRVLFGIYTPAFDIGSRNEPILARRRFEIWKMQTRSLYRSVGFSVYIRRRKINIKTKGYRAHICGQTGQYQFTGRVNYIHYNYKPQISVVYIIYI